MKQSHGLSIQKSYCQNKNDNSDDSDNILAEKATTLVAARVHTHYPVCSVASPPMLYTPPTTVGSPR